MTRLAPVLLISAVVACAPSAGETGGSDLSAGIDADVELYLSVDGAPGVSVAVVHRGDTLAMKGYGYADVENRVPASDQTVYRIGSVTKQFTAAAIMQMVEERRLRLDDTVGQLLPYYGGPGGGVTVHQLLNHTSGIPSYRARRKLTQQEVLSYFSNEPLHFDSGTRFAYSNSGYYLLGIILERLTGENYGDHLVRRQFVPLGLETMGQCKPHEIVENRAAGYSLGIGRSLRNAPSQYEHDYAAAGGLCGTVRDLVGWASALAAGQVVTAESYNRMTSLTQLPDRSVAYGYGLNIREVHGRKVVSHRGSIPGFQASLAHFPDEDLTIVILTNGRGGVGV